MLLFSGLDNIECWILLLSQWINLNRNREFNANMNVRNCFLVFVYLSRMWADPRHNLYFGSPQADDGQTVKKRKGGRVGTQKYGESWKHVSSAFRRHFSVSTFFLSPRLVSACEACVDLSIMVKIIVMTQRLWNILLCMDWYYVSS